jgi:hypothetical protein
MQESIQLSEPNKHLKKVTNPERITLQQDIAKCFQLWFIIVKNVYTKLGSLFESITYCILSAKTTPNGTLMVKLNKDKLNAELDVFLEELIAKS